MKRQYKRKFFSRPFFPFTRCLTACLPADTVHKQSTNLQNTYFYAFLRNKTGFNDLFFNSSVLSLKKGFILAIQIVCLSDRQKLAIFHYGEDLSALKSCNTANLGWLQVFRIKQTKNRNFGKTLTHFQQMCYIFLNLKIL